MKGGMKEKMDQARLNELLPGFDKDDEWHKLAGKLGHSRPHRIAIWKYAAVVAVLLVSTAVVALLSGSNKGGASVVNNERIHPQDWQMEVLPGVPVMHEYAVAEHEVAEKTVKPVANTPNEINKTSPIRNKIAGTAGYKRTEEFVCNGTPCPLEICIIQTIRCKDKAPSAIATCNTLEPDQARQLHYRSPEAVGAHCRVTVDEIRIRRVTTGETIVLNSHSQPSTAQDLFNCITGKEKCNLLAGIFESDCNDQQRSHGLKIDNSMGSLIME